jgi:hypothetical protein
MFSGENSMHHVLAFAAASGAAVTDTQLNAVAEEIFTRQNNSFQIPDPLELLWAYVGGATVTRARINTASLRLRGFPQLIPFNAALLPGDFTDIMDVREWPLMLRAMEDLRVDITNGAAETDAVVVAVSKPGNPLNVNMRDIRYIRFTASVTAVAANWSTVGAISFQDVLEGGRYAVYGAHVMGANIIAARFLFTNQTYRPGVIAVNAAGQKERDLFYGGMGLYGYFDTYQFPQIETLESAAGASTIEGHLLVSKA